CRARSARPPRARDRWSAAARWRPGAPQRRRREEYGAPVPAGHRRPRVPQRASALLVYSQSSRVWVLGVGFVILLLLLLVLVLERLSSSSTSTSRSKSRSGG